MTLNLKVCCVGIALTMMPALKTWAQESLNAGGAYGSASTGSTSYSIGQLHFEYAESPSGSVFPGVQQPIEIYKLGVGTEHKRSVGIFPNPAGSFIHLVLGGQVSRQLKYLLYDLSGKLLAESTITQQQMQISLEAFPTGTYILTVQDKQTQLQNFKIIKNF